MSLQIYKPNKSNTGFAFSFYMGEDRKNKLPILFLNAIAQYSWDDKKRIGSFSGNKDNPDKNLSIKFNEFEVGSIISAIKNRFEWNTYHAFEENKTQIKLSPWDKPIKIIEPGEAECLRVLCETLIENRYKILMQSQKDYNKNKSEKKDYSF